MSSAGSAELKDEDGGHIVQYGFGDVSRLAARTRPLRPSSSCGSIRSSSDRATPATCSTGPGTAATFDLVDSRVRHPHRRPREVGGRQRRRAEERERLDVRRRRTRRAPTGPGTRASRPRHRPSVGSSIRDTVPTRATASLPSDAPMPPTTPAIQVAPNRPTATTPDAIGEIGRRQQHGEREQHDRLRREQREGGRRVRRPVVHRRPDDEALGQPGEDDEAAAERHQPQPLAQQERRSGGSAGPARPARCPTRSRRPAWGRRGTRCPAPRSG